MGIYVLLLIAFVFLSLNPVKGKENFNKDYLSFDTTTSVKGIFIIIIFLSHATQYFDSLPKGRFSGVYDVIYYLGQTIVICFFLYSGYGVMKGYLSKGEKYIRQFPYRRIFKVLVHFDLALVFYIIMSFALGKKLKPFKILTALVGWSSIGNSNWFIFVILIMYVAAFIGFFIFRKNKYAAAVTISILCAVYMAIISHYAPTRFYNTVYFFPIGIWYAIFQEKIENLLMKNYRLYYVLTGIIALVFAYSYFKCKYPKLRFIAFGLLLILVFMKVRVESKILLWFGKRSFSIFILMRLPMMLISDLNLIDDPKIFTAVTFVLTALIAFAYDKLLEVIDAKLFPRPAVKAPAAPPAENAQQ